MADELGEDVTVIQRTLGHANPTLTNTLYVGKIPKALRRVSDRYNALLCGADRLRPERQEEGWASQ